MLVAFVLAEKTNLLARALFRTAYESFHWVDEMDINGSTGLIPLYVDGVRAMGGPRGQLMRDAPNFWGSRLVKRHPHWSCKAEIAPQRAVRLLGRHREKSLSVSFCHVLCARLGNLTAMM
jgi:hypothetical protein